MRGNIFPRAMVGAAMVGLASAEVAADCPTGPGVNASDNLCSAVQVSWATISGAIGYDVLRSTVPSTGGGTIIANNIPGTFFLDSTAAPGVIHYYFVRGRVVPNPFSCASGIGDWGGPNQGSFVQAPPMVNFGGSPVNDNGCAPVITFSVVNPGTWTLYRNANAPHFPDAVIIGSGPSGTAPVGVQVTDSGAPAAAGADIYYWVQTSNACGSPLLGPLVGQRPFSGPPAPPAWVVASDGTECGQVRLTWPASDETTSYHIEVLSGPGGSLLGSLMVPDDGVSAEYSHVFPEVQPPSGIVPSRHYRVRAINACGPSPFVVDSGTPGAIVYFTALSNVAVNAGQPATMSAVVVSASSMRWRRDGQPLFDGGRISGATEMTLNITPAKIEDAGEYTIWAEGVCGEAISAQGVLAVRIPCRADFNGDGTVSVQDIYDFLFLWTAGCP